LLLHIAPALAQTTAVLGVGGRGTTEFRDGVTQSLIDTVGANPDLELVDRHDLVTEDAMGLLGCSEWSADCLLELADTLEVDRILLATVEGEPGAFEIDVRYFDVGTSAFLLEQRAPYTNDEEVMLVELRLTAVVGDRVVLRVVSERDDVNVRVGDEDLGLAPVVALDLEAGRHVITATCDGCRDTSRMVQVVPGRFYTETITPRGDAVAGGGDDPEDPIPGGDGMSPYLVPGITIGVGAALLGTGIAFGVMTNSTQSDFDATDSYAEALDLADTGDTQALLTNVFLISGAAVAVTGALLFVLADDEESPTEQPRQTATPTPNAWFGPEGGGLSVDFTF